MEGVRRLTELLHSQWYEVCTVDSDQSCFRQIQMRKPDLILLEMDNPGIDVGRLKLSLRERYPEIPIVMLAAEPYLAELRSRNDFQTLDTTVN